MTDIRFPPEQTAHQWQNHPALISADRCMDYARFLQATDNAVQCLKNAGIRKGDRLAIVADTSPDFVVLLAALLKMRAVACPLSPRHPPATLWAMADKVGAGALIIDARHPMRRDASKTIHMEILGGVIDASAPEAVEAGRMDLDQDATIIFTSGSSGLPKAALHSFANHYYSALGANENISLNPGDRWLLTLPLYHVGGIGVVFRCLLAGAAVVIPDRGEPLGAAMGRFAATHISLVATQLRRLLNEGTSRAVAAGLKAVLLGGSAVSPELIRQAHKRGFPICLSYGLTEMASQVTTTHPGDPLERCLTSGKGLSHREVRISREGEIYVRGKTLFKGYVDKTRCISPKDTKGWFHTSDLGSLDSHGYLSVTGRKDNLFISGGENIQPEEIEKILCRLEDVEQALVVPVPDTEFGHRPAAFVQTRGGRPIQAPAYVSFLEERLPRFKIPVWFFPWPEALKPAGLKPSRKSFAALAEKLSRT